MKTAEDFKRAIGPADEVFSLRVRQTLARLQAEEEKPMKKKITPVLAIVLALLLASTAYAAAVESGWLHYLHQRHRAVLPETEQLIAQAYTLPTPIDTPLMTIDTIQSLHDGSSLMLYFRMVPKENLFIVIDSCITKYMADPNDALTPADIMNQPIAEMGSDFWGDEYDGMTLRDYLLREGKGLLLVNVWADVENSLTGGRSNQTNADGSYETMLTLDCSTDADTLTAQITYQYLYVTAERIARSDKLLKTEWYADFLYDGISVTVPANQPMEHGRLTQPVRFDAHGTTLEAVDVTLTPFHMRFELTWNCDTAPLLTDTVSSQLNGGIFIDNVRICSNSEFERGKDCYYIIYMTFDYKTRTVTMTTDLDPQATLPASVWIDWDGEVKEIPLIESIQ